MIARVFFSTPHCAAVARACSGWNLELCALTVSYLWEIQQAIPFGVFLSALECPLIAIGFDDEGQTGLKAHLTQLHGLNGGRAVVDLGWPTESALDRVARECQGETAASRRALLRRREADPTEAWAEARRGARRLLFLEMPDQTSWTTRAATHLLQNMRALNVSPTFFARDWEDLPWPVLFGARMQLLSAEACRRMRRGRARSVLSCHGATVKRSWLRLAAELGCALGTLWPHDRSPPQVFLLQPS